MGARPLLDRILFGPDEPSRPATKGPDAASRAQSMTYSADVLANMDEKRIHITARELPCPCSDQIDSSAPPSPLRRVWRRDQRHPYSWKSTPWQVRPIAGITALGISLLCTIASSTVLRVSDGGHKRLGGPGPAVYLAMFTTASNGAIAFAKMEATPISW